MKPIKEALTPTEYAIMEILWDSNEPLTNPEIQEDFLTRHSSGIKTVHNITARLLKKGYIKEDVIIKIKKRFAQKYAVAVSAEEYMQWQIESNYYFKKAPDHAATMLISNLLNDEIIGGQAIDEMSKILEQHKKE